MNKYKIIMLIIALLFLLFTPAYSWFGGDAENIFLSYVEQSNSKYAVDTRDDLFYMKDNILITYPLFVSKLNQNDRNLINKAFITTTLKDGIKIDAPTELTLFDWILSKFTRDIRVMGPKKSFGKFIAPLGEDIELNISSDYMATDNYLLFIVSDDPNIFNITYDNLHSSTISCRGLEKGTTKVRIMLISDSGTKFNDLKVKVK